MFNELSLWAVIVNIHIHLLVAHDNKITCNKSIDYIKDKCNKHSIKIIN